MTTTRTEIANSHKRIGVPAKRNVAPSGSVDENIFDFLLDVDPSIYSLDEIETLEQLFGDLEYMYHVGLKEAAHFTKKSTMGARITARKWYKKNRGRVKKLADRLKKSKGLQKKKEVLAKSGRNLKKKKKKKYPGTKSHVNEAINRNIERGAKKIVDKMFENTPYRVIRSFTIDGDVEAVLNEKIEHVCAGIWILTKRNGNRYKLSVTNNNFITPYINHEKDITVEDFI